MNTGIGIFGTSKQYTLYKLNKLEWEEVVYYTTPSPTPGVVNGIIFLGHMNN